MKMFRRIKSYSNTKCYYKYGTFLAKKWCILVASIKDRGALSIILAEEQSNFP